MEETGKVVELFEGKRATNYDDFVQQWIPNYDYFMSILPKLFRNVDEKTLLAVGCGTGNEMLVLKDYDTTWSILGVDPSPEMIYLAKKKLAGHENIEFFTGEVQHLGHQHLFGAASLLLVLHFIKYPNEKLKLLKEIQERLKPGAPLIIMGIFGNKQQVRANLETLTPLLSNLLSENEIEERLERIKKKLYRTSEEDLEKLLIKAGFETPTRFFQTSIYSGWITNKRTL